jgi:hypothetical protein
LNGGKLSLFFSENKKAFLDEQILSEPRKDNRIMGEKITVGRLG